MQKRQQLAPGIAAYLDRELAEDEYARRRAIPVSDEDVEETMAQVRWFRARYPTAKERFAYVRRKYAEWTRNPPVDIAELMNDAVAPGETTRVGSVDEAGTKGFGT